VARPADPTLAAVVASPVPEDTAGTLAATRAPAKRNSSALLNKGCPLNTITPHLAVATVLAVRHLGYVHPLATPSAATANVSGGMALAAVVLVLALLAAIARAARGLAALAAEFLRVAAEMTSAVLILLLIGVVAVVLLIHR
jgi:hypothetical protein